MIYLSRLPRLILFDSPQNPFRFIDSRLALTDNQHKQREISPFRRHTHEGCDGTGIAESPVQHLSREIEERKPPMTQELVLGVLLTGFVGLIWAMTVSLLWNDHADGDATALDASSESSSHADVDRSTSERRTIAA